jgi:hypothetical protein
LVQETTREGGILSDVIITLSNNTNVEDSAAVLPLLDEDIERFSQYMASLPDSRAAGPLINPERALLKTYLVAKLRGKI